MPSVFFVLTECSWRSLKSQEELALTRNTINSYRDAFFLEGVHDFFQMITTLLAVQAFEHNRCAALGAAVKVWYFRHEPGLAFVPRIEEGVGLRVWNPVAVEESILIKNHATAGRFAVRSFQSLSRAVFLGDAGEVETSLEIVG
jgi:hypothetical protein